MDEMKFLESQRIYFGSKIRLHAFNIVHNCAKSGERPV